MIISAVEVYLVIAKLLDNLRGATHMFRTETIELAHDRMLVLSKEESSITLLTFLANEVFIKKFCVNKGMFGKFAHKVTEIFVSSDWGDREGFAQNHVI